MQTEEHTEPEFSDTYRYQQAPRYECVTENYSFIFLNQNIMLWVLKRTVSIRWCFCLSSNNFQNK